MAKQLNDTQVLLDKAFHTVEDEFFLDISDIGAESNHDYESNFCAVFAANLHQLIM